MPLQATSGAASYDAFGGGVVAEPNYIESCFSTWLYTGNNSTLSINNGIDVSGKGGLVWIKSRSQAGYYNTLVDTARGPSNQLYSNAPDAQYTATGLDVTAFTSTGFTLGPDNFCNQGNGNYASWTFRKQPKFFDVVTYTGNGGTQQNIPHNLQAFPGCIFVKRTDAAGDWYVAPIMQGNWNNDYLVLNSTAAKVASADIWQGTSGTSSTTFGVRDGSTVNISGATYVAYLFAASGSGGFGLTGTDNVISCGSYTGQGGTQFSVSLGYEPQWIMVKPSSQIGNWTIVDNMRGMVVNNNGSGMNMLRPNLSNAESAQTNFIQPTSTGFTVGVSGQSNSDFTTSGATYIYIAIRRGPMKVPTDGTKVFAPITRTGTGSATTQTAGFPVDLFIPKTRNGGTPFTWSDRLRGDTLLLSSNAQAENYPAYVTFDNQTGINLTSYFYNNNASAEPYGNLNFRRAPGFFDEVCYTGTGSARTVAHNLAAVPELIIVKQRNNSDYFWSVQWLGLNDRYMKLNSTMAADINPFIWGVAPTSSTFGVSSEVYTNASGGTYVAYLFASCPGVSKVFSFTGNGTTQTINCGFTGGARFVLLKATSTTGGWYVYDTARGMTTLTDPYLQLNSTAAESATLGSVTTVATGFAVNESVLAGVNTNGVSYIGLAVA